MGDWGSGDGGDKRMIKIISREMEKNDVNDREYEGKVMVKVMAIKQEFKHRKVVLVTLIITTRVTATMKNDNDNDNGNNNYHYHYGKSNNNSNNNYTIIMTTTACYVRQR